MTAEPRNAASDSTRSTGKLWTDWESLVANWESWYADDFVRDDRRRLINMPLADRAAYLDHSRVWFEIADGHPTFTVTEVLAVRGDRFVASIIEVTYEDAPSVRAVIVQQYDADVRRVERQVHFDLEDVDAALAELNALYAAVERPDQPTSGA